MYASRHKCLGHVTEGTPSLNFSIEDLGDPFMNDIHHVTNGYTSRPKCMSNVTEGTLSHELMTSGLGRPVHQRYTSRHTCMSHVTEGTLSHEFMTLRLGRPIHQQDVLVCQAEGVLSSKAQNEKPSG